MKQRISSESGIAVGVVLFALAIIAAVAIAMGAGGNTMGSSTISIDRISADVKSQGNLIMSKIRQCYTTATIDEQASCANNAWDAGTSAWTRPECTTIDRTAYYPVGAAPAGILVSSIVCPGYRGTDGSNLWTGNAPAMLPPPSSGLNPWYYVNAQASGGGICIRIQPLASSVNDGSVRAGLAQASNSYGANEYTYTPGSTSQRFIFWIVRPTGVADAGCAP
ncbi:MAG: hypothetical protein K2Q32_04715 [Alphaproteobacteria bacterium]|nr:hypothetical protein [Alphaproteobacteria bacterium]